MPRSETLGMTHCEGFIHIPKSFAARQSHLRASVSLLVETARLHWNMPRPLQLFDDAGALVVATPQQTERMDWDRDDDIDVVRPAFHSTLVGCQPQFLHEESRDPSVQPRPVVKLRLTKDAAKGFLLSIEAERRGMLEGEPAEQLALDIVARQLGMNPGEGNGDKRPPPAAATCGRNRDTYGEGTGKA